MYMPPSPCALPTVDEEGSQELAPEPPEDHRKTEGLTKEGCLGYPRFGIVCGREKL